MRSSSNSNGSLSGLLSLRSVVEMTGLHPNSVRRYADSGELRTITLPSGHRRWRRSDVLEFLDLEETEETSTDRVIIYARVSGSNRASGFKSKGSLDNDLGRQLSELRAYVKEKHKGCKIAEYTDVGSGISLTRPRFVKMIDGILAGSYDGCVLVCSFHDRVSRFGMDLVLQVCRAHNITVQCASDNPDQLSDDETLANSILDFCHVYSSKRYSKRSAAKRTKQIPQDKLQECIQLLKSGWSVRAISRKMEKDKVVDQFGEPIKFSTLRNHMLRQKEMLELVMDSVPENSFQRFYKSKLRKCSKKAEISWKIIIARYETWCQKHGETKVTTRAIKKHLESVGVEHYVYRKKGMSELRFKGLSVLAIGKSR